MEQLMKALTNYGFSEKETTTYLAMLELGTSTANKISGKAKLNRSTTYDLLKKLIEQGIVSKTIKNKTAYFSVISPEKLISKLDDKKEKLLEVLDQLKIIEEQTINKPVVKVYEGVEGFNTILQDILLTKKQTDVISTSKVFDIMIYNFPHYITKRSELKIFARVIQEESPQTKALKKYDKKEYRETKLIKGFNINSMTFIYGKKTATIKLIKNQIICVQIEDQSLADDQKRIFEELWNKAE